MSRLLLLFALATSFSAEAGQTVFESKPTRAYLIELFTSEGCSSCPPADEWINGLKNHPRLWQDIVPLAFHVDYWDHLGWHDPFASTTSTERQADYSARWKKDSVYTPAFVLNGNEWRSSPLPPVSTETPGILKLIVNSDRVSASYKPSANNSSRYEIHLALLGFSLAADVTAGENAGKKLSHDFVVLGLTNETMKAGAKELKLPVSTQKSTVDPRMALAAWVTRAGQIEPVQAVGGWLP